jgi:hypothetical protein
MGVGSVSLECRAKNSDIESTAGMGWLVMETR